MKYHLSVHKQERQTGVTFLLPATSQQSRVNFPRPEITQSKETIIRSSYSKDASLPFLAAAGTLAPPIMCPIDQLPRINTKQ